MTTKNQTNKDNNLPQVFNFDNHQVRTVTHSDGQTWFVANDIAEALGYKKTENAIARHCKRSTTTPKQGGGSFTLIPESDLYRLIFGSKLKAADKFTDWVTNEVLPQIRQTGGYSYQQPQQLDKTQADAARKIITKFLKDYESKHAPKGQFINTRRALMQVHGFIHKYYNIASYKNLDADDLATLDTTLNDNARAVLSVVKDLFVIDLKDDNAIHQDENSIRISGKNGIRHLSMGYVLEQIDKAENQQSKILSLPDVHMPHHMEMILTAIQGTLINCNNQLDMVKSNKLDMDLEDRVKLMKSIAPNLKLCMTNIEVVTQSMFLENFEAAKNTTAKEVLDSIGYSIL